MKKRNVQILSILFLLVSGVLTSCGSTSGTSSGTQGNPGQAFSGTISGDNYKDHRISFRNGQVLTVYLESTNKSCYFNVLTESNEAIFNGSSEGNRFTGTMSFTGNYKVRVYLMGAANSNKETVNYTIRYTLQ